MGLSVAAVLLVLGVRDTIIEGRTVREAQDRCTQTLEAEWQHALTKTVIYPAGSPERLEWGIRLNAAADRLGRLQDECYADPPASPPRVPTGSTTRTR